MLVHPLGVLAWVERGTLRFPENDTPCILIGPGTGVAPFRAFVEDRHSRGIGNSLLIFGCRYSTKDFLYRDDWRHFQDSGNLQLLTAFSRDQQSKIYVQDAIREHGAELADWILRRGAWVYICGNAKRMPLEVHGALGDILKEFGPFEEEALQEYLSSLEKARRIQIEAWS
eukprot:m.16653 g.16653  ORF g.16653 m.16653 type:complete len:171 (+) comp28546_c0_seq1:2626-3138(+)